MVRPQIVAGVNALGRGQDRESLTQFVGTIAQTMGPEALMRYVDPSEYIKRLAAAQGIDVLNLVKTNQQLQQEMQAQQEAAQQQELMKQAGKFASAPMMDPSKNPQMAEQMGAEEEQPDVEEPTEPPTE
jgi:23S rRNA pseudoU1915 N3-methylase RlmH